MTRPGVIARRAAERCGVSPGLAEAVLQSYWAAVSAALAKAHEEGPDPRVPPFWVRVPGLGTFSAKPGPTVRRPEQVKAARAMGRRRG